MGSCSPGIKVIEQHVAKLLKNVSTDFIASPSPLAMSVAACDVSLLFMVLPNKGNKVLYNYSTIYNFYNSECDLPAIMSRTIEALSFCIVTLPAIPHSHSIKRDIPKLSQLLDKFNPDTITSFFCDMHSFKDSFGAHPGKHQSFT